MMVLNEDVMESQAEMDFILGLEVWDFPVDFRRFVLIIK
jgi:hypothetical protein